MNSIKVIIILLFFSCINSTEFMSDCTTDELCHQIYTSSYECVKNKCHHRQITAFRDFWGLLLICIIVALANVGGIGGGALLIPIYVLVFNFTIGGAIPLSKAAIVSGAFTNFFCSYDNRLKNHINVFMIDYKLVSFIVPLILGGTMVGVMVMKMFPALLIFGFLILYLFLTIHKIFKKAIQLHQKEQQKQIEKDKDQGIELQLLQGQVLEDQQSSQTQNIYKKPFMQLFEPHKINIAICIATYLLILLSALLRGGKGMASIIGLDQCSSESWMIFLVVQVCCILGGFRVFKKQQNMEKSDVLNQSKNKDDSILASIDKINSHLMQSLFFNSYFSGILAGALGIGGGLVINPVLLKEGIPPQIAAAVSSCVVLATSLSTTTQFLIAGAFDFSIAIYIIVASALGSYIGNKIFKVYISKYNKPSIVVWILGFLLLFSGIVLSIVGSYKIFQQKDFFKFNSPCQLIYVLSLITNIIYQIIL